MSSLRNRQIGDENLEQGQIRDDITVGHTVQQDTIPIIHTSSLNENIHIVGQGSIDGRFLTRTSSGRNEMVENIGIPNINPIGLD